MYMFHDVFLLIPVGLPTVNEPTVMAPIYRPGLFNTSADRNQKKSTGCKASRFSEGPYVKF